MEAEKKGFVPKHYSILSDILFFADYFKREEPMVLLLTVLEILLKSTVPLFGIWLPKLAVDLVQQGAATAQTAATLGGFVLLMIIVNGAAQAVQGGKYHLYNTQRTNLIGTLFLKSLRIRYADVESGEIKKVYVKAQGAVQSGDWSAMSMTVYATTDLCVNMLCFVLYSTVIGYLNSWMLAILIGLSLINYVLRLRHIKKQETYREENAEAWRHFNSVNNAMGNLYGAKDVRIFGMKHWLLQLRDVVIGELTDVQRKYQLTSGFYARIDFILSALRDLGAYAWLLYQASEGKLTAGEFVLYFGAVTGFSAFVDGMMFSIASLRGAANDTDYVRAYLELPEEDRISGNRHIEELAQPLSIEFRDVSFSYKQWHSAE